VVVEEGEEEEVEEGEGEEEEVEEEEVEVEEEEREEEEEGGGGGYCRRVNRKRLSKNEDHLRKKIPTLLVDCARMQLGRQGCECGSCCCWGCWGYGGRGEGGRTLFLAEDSASKGGELVGSAPFVVGGGRGR